MNLLTLNNLTKNFEETFKLGPVSLTLESGKTVAFLGRNGAGKSTLFNLITGNLDASSGEVLVEGKRMTPDTPMVKKTIGYLPQKHVLPRWSTAQEILTYAAGLYGIQDAKGTLTESMKKWDCASYAKKPLATLSHGMRKRVGLALATLNNPEILILDEPFSGLDLFQIKALETEIITREKNSKLTILSTHIAPYTAKLCSAVYIVENGIVNSMDQYEQGGFEERITTIESYFFGANS
jgi:ABC-type multidrug transport system ATPase subunit